MDFGFVPLRQPSVTLSGSNQTATVLPARGRKTPVGGMVITATDSTGTVYTTTTDANGYYTFSVPADVYTVTYGSVPERLWFGRADATPNSGTGGQE
ncbi:MAG: carboxypeptidase regulatory-like domain-containing protein [Caldilineaceae bacterium]